MSGGVRRLSWRFVPSSLLTSRSARARYTTTKPVLESLEGRQLLALFTGFSHVRNIPTPSGVYSLQIDGPGVLKTQPAGGGSFDVKVLGTTDASTLTITQVRPRFHVVNGLMSIDDLIIRSGQIGGILASPVELDGAMTPVNSDVGTLEFGTLGPGAQIDVHGSVGTMNVGSVNLGPGGRVVISDDLNSASESPDQSSTTTGMTIASMNLDGGQFVIGGESLDSISIAGDLSLSHNGLLAIQTGTLSVGGSVIIGSGGQLNVRGNLTALTVGRNVLIGPGASGIVVGGDLDAMSVGGYFSGQGSATAIDLGVALNLNSLTVEGGGTSTSPGGIQSANINVGKNISNLDVSYGIFRSWITAGLSINGVNDVGADGVTAIYNSEIDAGTSITNLTVGGNVVSDFPTNLKATGYPTRIIAGKIRAAAIGSTPDQGNYLPNGLINNLMINGALIDAVLAASVAPFGGNGSLPPPPPLMYGVQPQSAGKPPGYFTNYQAPAGMTNNTPNYSNYSIRDVTGGVPTGDAAWAQPIGSRHDTVLNNGSITTVTVTGGVISTQTDPRLDDTYDYAGFFAVNTIGVVNGGPAS